MFYVLCIHVYNVLLYVAAVIAEGAYPISCQTKLCPMARPNYERIKQTKKQEYLYKCENYNNNHNYRLDYLLLELGSDNLHTYISNRTHTRTHIRNRK